MRVKHYEFYTYEDLHYGDSRFVNEGVCNRIINNTAYDRYISMIKEAGMDMTVRSFFFIYQKEKDINVVEVEGTRLAINDMKAFIDIMGVLMKNYNHAEVWRMNKEASEMNGWNEKHLVRHWD